MAPGTEQGIVTVLGSKAKSKRMRHIPLTARRTKSFAGGRVQSRLSCFTMAMATARWKQPWRRPRTSFSISLRHT